MRKTIQILVAALLLLSGVAGCTKEESAPQNEFYVKAQKDGQAWERPGTGTLVRSSNELFLFGQNRAAGTEEYLRLSLTVPRRATPAQVQALSAEWGEVVGGDVLVNSYSTEEAQTVPSVEITRLDTVQRIVEGRFSTTLKREARWSTQGEVMRFTQGEFRIRYQIFQ